MLRTVYERHGDWMLLAAEESAGLVHGPLRETWYGVWTSNPAVLRTICNYIRQDIYAKKLYYRFADLLHATYGPELELATGRLGTMSFPPRPCRRP